jgi:hypothetical protein
MTTLINSIDNTLNKVMGENGHYMLPWSDKIEEKIVQYYFQLIRQKDMKLDKKFADLLCEIKEECCVKKRNEYMVLLYKLIGYTRDIEEGKGERLLSYKQLYILWLSFPRLGEYMFETFVYIENKHQYGGWMDVKYMCDYVVNETKNSNHFIIEYIVNLTNFHLKKDYDKLKTRENVSLISKWIPREKSKYKWLFKKLAKNMYSKYLFTADTSNKLVSARKKCYTNYRKLLSTLNRYIDTVQIKMTEKKWKYINPKKVTAITMMKNKEAFLNRKKESMKIVERYDLEDRKECAENFKKYFSTTKTIKGKTLNTYELVREAFRYRGDKEMEEIINKQWLDNSEKNYDIGNAIALVDTSGSMEIDECVPLYNAIGLGIRISEKTTSLFKNRLLTFDNEPKWWKFDEKMTFCEKCYKLKEAPWGMNTNFYKTMKMILSVIIENNVPPEEVSNFSLIILSDMQIDESLEVLNKNFKNKYNTMMDNIKDLYKKAGLESAYDEEYKVPHIIFWNLRKTKGFPNKSMEQNTTMLSGYSSTLMNSFCDKGINELKNYNPWTMLKTILNNERYKILENHYNKLYKNNE